MNPMIMASALTLGLLGAAAKPSSHPPQPQRQLYSEALRLLRGEEFDEALVMMESFAHQYPESSLADNAIYWMGQIYLQKNERALAKDEFKRILKYYPKSDRSERAEAQIRILEERPLDESQQKESP